MARGLSVGDRAPDFALPSTQGEVSLAALCERGSVLLVFYPGDDTPVCTKQLCDYRDHLGAFADLGVQVVAINPQPMASHEAFAQKHALPFPVASDADKRVCRAYDAIGLLGMTKRALVLVGPDGRVRWTRTDLPVFHRSAAELREVIASLP
ncbi:MAG: peroxiredoxin [Myxococcota bacterium]|nr:peroxiredoxin [Myxococcales bacterium]